MIGASFHSQHNHPQLAMTKALERNVAVAPDFPKHIGQGAEEKVGPLCPTVRLHPQVPGPSHTNSNVYVFQLGRWGREGSCINLGILTPTPPWLLYAQSTRFAKTKMLRTFENRTKGEAKAEYKTMKS